MYSERICAVLGWNQGQLSWFQYEIGLKYLELYTAPEGVKKILEGNREFWGWWKLNWNVRDEAFIEQDMSALPRHQCIWIYKALHDPQVIVQDVYPNQWIINPCIKAYTASLKSKSHATIRS